MILSASSASLAKTCWRKAFNVYHRGITFTDYNLVDGGAMHAGIAYGLATKDWEGAKAVAVDEFEKRVTEMGASLEYEVLAHHHKELVVEMVKAYEEGFRGQDVQVIQPECKFVVQLKDSWHNDITTHWQYEGQDCWSNDVMHRSEDMIQHKRLALGGPTAEMILSGGVRSPHPTPDSGCECWQPHRVVGTTDAIVRWRGNLWLLEHKSTSIQGEVFWKQFRLDLQPTVYLLGISRKLGITPAGFIINAINKPSAAQVANWNNKRKDKSVVKTEKDYISYAREPFLRTEKDLQRMEKDLVELGEEWEWRVLKGRFSMSNTRGICTMFRRTCSFHAACIDHDEGEELVQLMALSLKPVVEEEE